jgi:hypothetical protein
MMTSKKNRWNNKSCNGDNHHWAQLMVQNSPLLTMGNLAHPCSCLCVRSPRGAGHGLHGNGVPCPPKSSRSPWGAGHGLQEDGVTHPPNCTMMPTPPPAAHPAPSSTDMVPAPTMLAADHPPQDMMTVYTITSLMDSSKPTSSFGSTNTRSYLMTAASPGGLCLTSTRGDGTPWTVDQGAVSPFNELLAVAISNNTAGAKKAIALVGLPASISGGLWLQQPRTA